MWGQMIAALKRDRQPQMTAVILRPANPQFPFHNCDLISFLFPGLLFCVDLTYIGRYMYSVLLPTRRL
jgi:hypothetical protein